jgi:hypothetical protein
MAMRTVSRFLFCLFLSASIGLAAIPRPAAPSVQIEKKSCCAKMKTAPKARDCEQHAPKSDDDKQCCALCASGLALFAAVTAPFVYPPLGDETFAAYISSEHDRSQEPPVPPPRYLI